MEAAGLAEKFLTTLGLVFFSLVFSFRFIDLVYFCTRRLLAWNRNSEDQPPKTWN